MMDPDPSKTSVMPVSFGPPARVSIVDESAGGFPMDQVPLLVCFPSAGLASTIVGHHVVRHLKLPRVATVRSSGIPPATVIVEKRPNPPVRIHASPTVIVALSEFPAPSPFAQGFAESLLHWAQQKRIGPIIVVEGVLKKEDGEPGGESETMMGIAATPASEALLEKAKVPLLIEGIVGGLTAELLNLAAVIDRQLAVVFATTTEPGYPDYRAAARLVEVLDRVVPGLALDPAPMLQQAELLEKMLKEGMRLHKAAQPGGSEEIPSPGTSHEPSMFG
jgi:uncharacterized protein